MWRSLMLSAALLASAPLAAADEPPANTLATSPAPPKPREAPRWVRRPSADDIARVYPDRALTAHPSGKVVISCKIDPAGKMAGCTVVSETPPGAGFGAAALALAPEFQMSPPLAGATMTIPIHFQAP
jgi:periplasmic protein TonB